MILMSVFESIKRECFPSPRGWVMGHCSVGCAGRDRRDISIKCNSDIHFGCIRLKFHQISKFFLLFFPRSRG
jgi:hypothetical protein